MFHSTDVVAHYVFLCLPDVDQEFAVYLCFCCNVLSVVEQQLVDASVLDGTVSEVLYARVG